MKISCPNCKKVLQAPNEWSGKKVKCPGCHKMIKLPSTSYTSSDDMGLDLDSLNAIESNGEEVIFERKGKPMTLKQAQAAAAAAIVEVDEKPPPIDPTIRICPGCGKKIRCDDPYCDVMCQHCGAGIPPPRLDTGVKAGYESGMTDRVKSKVSFYTGFSNAPIYPIPGIAAIVLAMIVALVTIAVPLFSIFAFYASAGLNPISGEETDFGWVAVFLKVMFSIQGIYFGAVAYYAMIDTIRSTAGGNEQPPDLTWNVLNLGVALTGYVTLLAVYGIIVLVLTTITIGRFPNSMNDFSALSNIYNIIVLAMLTFVVPMNMIGLASSHALDGLNPIRFGPSIGRLIGHYTFLYLIMLIYLALSVGVMIALLSWATPHIMNAAEQGIQQEDMKGSIVKMLAGLGAWSIVVGAGFYFAYAIGRILGLFTRTFREEIEFDL